MSENPPPGFDEIHGSLTAPLLPSLEGSEVLVSPAPDVPARPTNPTLPTLDWSPTVPSEAPPPPAIPAAAASATEPARIPAAPAIPAPLVEESPPPAPALVAAAPEPVLVPTPAPALAAPAGAPAMPASPTAPALPSVTPSIPVPPPAAGSPPAFPFALDAPSAQPLGTHRIRDAVGGIVRTLVLAALVAGAVFGGRYVWDWNEDRHSDAVAVDGLPAAAVPAPNARYVVYRSVESAPVIAHVDLATGDFSATISETTELALRGDEYWARGAVDGVWGPASAELLAGASEAIETITGASLLMISDVLPGGAHPYVTITADETVFLDGAMLSGPQVIDVMEPNAPADVPAQSPDGGSVLVRHLTVTVDRQALQTSDPMLAQTSGLGGASPLVIEIWVDGTGVVRKMSTPSGASRLPDQYELISASPDGLGPFVDLGLPEPLAVAPPEEATQ